MPRVQVKSVKTAYSVMCSSKYKNTLSGYQLFPFTENDRTSCYLHDLSLFSSLSGSCKNLTHD